MPKFGADYKPKAEDFVNQSERDTATPSNDADKLAKLGATGIFHPQLLGLTGTILPFGGAEASAPANWLICKGQEVSRSSYPQLFDVIGEKYGAGDGQDTFNLPDLRQRVPVGRDASDGFGDNRTNELGNSGGEKKHRLTVDEMPRHSHTYTPARRDDNGGGSSAGGYVGNDTQTSSTGGNDYHNNMQPYVVVNYIIAT